MNERLRNVLIFIGILVFVVWVFYEWEENNNYEIEYVEDQFPNVEEMHFVKMPITYAIEIHDEDYIDDKWQGKPYTVYTMNSKTKIQDIKTALEIIQNSTEGLVYFEEIENINEADLKIYAINPSEFENSEFSYLEDEEDFDVLGFAYPDYIVNENKIVNASVYFVPQMIYVNELNWGEGRCVGFPDLEIHEVLHAFGFGHVFDSPEQVMFPLKVRCKSKQLDENTINCLKKIYSNGEIEGDCSSVNIHPYIMEEKIMV